MLLFPLYFFPPPVSKQNMSETLINGDTAYMLICMALVNLMTPGLAFFYGGLVRSSNVLSIMAQNYASMGLMTIIWTAWGYVFLLSFLLLSCEDDDDASLLSPCDYGVVTKTRKQLLLTFFFFFFFCIVFEYTDTGETGSKSKST